MQFLGLEILSYLGGYDYETLGLRHISAEERLTVNENVLGSIPSFAAMNMKLTWQSVANHAEVVGSSPTIFAIT